MSDTCIVCLGDLGSGANEDPRISDLETEAPERGAAAADPEHPQWKPVSNDGSTELIAHLLPCGHDLHNECLKPWVERANSCPICRQSFNRVELSEANGGMSSRSIALRRSSLT